MKYVTNSISPAFSLLRGFDKPHNGSTLCAALSANLPFNFNGTLAR